MAIRLFWIHQLLVVFALSIIFSTFAGEPWWFFAAKESPMSCGNSLTDPVILAANAAVPLGIAALLILAGQQAQDLHKRLANIAVIAIVMTANTAILAWALIEWRQNCGFILNVWWLPLFH